MKRVESWQRLESRWRSALRWVAHRALRAACNDRPFTPPERWSGDAELLVYGECSDCGFHCGLPEGSRWPICPYCGMESKPRETREAPVPPPGQGRSVQGPGVGPWVAQANYGVRLGYVAFLMPEVEALARMGRTSVVARPVRRARPER